MKTQYIIITAIVVFLIIAFFVFLKLKKQKKQQSEVVIPHNDDFKKATVLTGGDLIISDSILKAAKTDDANYDFSFIFKYIKDYVKKADYAVINLETSFLGKEAGYCGFPKFNTPEVLIDTAIDAGFDMFLTASNHSYDLGYEGLIYKIKMLEKRGADYIGTRKSEKESLHKIVNVNGIKIGMLNYARESYRATREKPIMNSTRKRLNFEASISILDEKGKNLLAHYNNKYLDDFYPVLKKDIKKLKDDGADIIVAYPHWGKEYSIDYTSTEDEIAQKMCDYGVDLIIGGHPHVVQPTKIYTSDISGKTTFCIHSIGNFVSSMRSTSDDEKTPYVEDGVLFEYTVEKSSDGSCKITSVNALPLWVKKTKDKEFIVIPLDKSVDWKTNYNVFNYSEKESSGYQSFIRTDKLVSEEIKKFNNLISK